MNQRLLDLGSAALSALFGFVAIAATVADRRRATPGVHPVARPRVHVDVPGATPLQRALFALGDEIGDDDLMKIDQELAGVPAAAVAFLALPAAAQRQTVATITDHPDDLGRARELQATVRRLAFSARPDLLVPPTSLDLEAYIQRLSSSVQSVRSDAVDEFLTSQWLRDWPDDLRVQLRRAAVAAMEAETDPALRDRLRSAIVAAIPPTTDGV